MRLLHDKITVPNAHPRVSRKRLLQALDANLACYSATIINSRAGTGKTLLAAEFAQRCQRTVAWYKVEAADGRWPVFLNYLVGSIALHQPDFAKLVTYTVESEAQYVAESFAYALEQTVTGPLLLVLEDLHLIYDSLWVAPFLGRLTPLLPPEVHLLITGRALPPVSLWRLRSKQMLAVIEESVMAFTIAEAEALFASYNLPSDEAGPALKQARGCAAALESFAQIRSHQKSPAPSTPPTPRLNLVAAW